MLSLITSIKLNICFYGLIIGLIIGAYFPIYLTIVALLYGYERFICKDDVKHEDALVKEVNEIKSTISKLTFARRPS
jgi:hypothetical protein